VTTIAIGARDLERAAPQTPRSRWCNVTCEYPPITGGVSDHTFLLATALAESGDEVDVWCPPAPEKPEEPDESNAAPEIPGVTVHLLSSHFGLGAIRTLRRELRALPDDTRILVQWVPTAFGWRMLNLPFALMLFGLRGRRLDLYVHETGWEISSRETMRRALAGVVHRLMTWLAARSARHAFVTVPAWQSRLSFLGAHGLPPDEEATWVPIPSNVPDHADSSRVAELRRALLAGGRQRVVVGHFGTFGRFHTGLMPHVVSRILDEGADRKMLLVGRGGGALRDEIVAARPELATRIVATGGLAPEEVSVHLAACDVLVQPFDDGASSRRGSLMAGVALGRPVIANRGRNTEDVWAEERAIHLTESAAPHALAGALTKLLADPALCDRLSASARRLYAERFALAHGLAALRATDAVAPAEAVS
jgi:glycosyltransferase involved in cell wall biosynthesis